VTRTTGHNALRPIVRSLDTKPTGGHRAAEEFAVLQSKLSDRGSVALVSPICRSACSCSCLGPDRAAADRAYVSGRPPAFECRGSTSPEVALFTSVRLPLKLR
jgi:hypothetical protein